MANKKHNFTRTEIKAGFLVIASAAVLALFVAAVAGLRPPRPTKTYYADFVNIKGLQKGADVMFGGFKAGRVQALSLQPDRAIRVRFTVDENLPINAASRASIAQITLTSENHLEISTGSERAELLPPGAVLPSQEGGIFDVAGLVAQDVRELMGDVRVLLGVKERRREQVVTIEDLFTNIQTAVDESTGAVQDIRSLLADNRDEVSAILQRVQDIEKGAEDLIADLRGVVAENRPVIAESTANVRDATVDIRDAAADIRIATRRIEGLADSLEAVLNSAGQLGTDAQGFINMTRPVLEEIVLDLREAVWHMKNFARTIEEQPESVLRGASPQGRAR